MPGFVTTFETLKSIISFTLHTTFKCDLTSEAAESSSIEDLARDDEWVEYELPFKKADKSRTRRSMHTLTHVGAFPLDLALPYDSEKADIVKHYTDTTALIPVLSSSIDDAPQQVSYVGQSRHETQNELSKSRYDPFGRSRSRIGRCKADPHTRISPGDCWKLNGGSGAMHVAKLWQGVERRHAEKQQTSAFVVQS